VVSLGKSAARSSAPSQRKRAMTACQAQGQGRAVVGRLARASFLGTPKSGAPGILLAALFIVSLGLVGCGAGEGTTTLVPSVASPTPTQASTTASDSTSTSANAKVDRKESPGGGNGRVAAAAKDASASSPDAPLSRSVAVRETGRRACAGMSPLEAAKHYELPARHAGVDKEFAKFVAHPPPSTETSDGFPRLVAALYASTLPAAQRADAAAGCAEELASPGSGGQASSKRAKRQGLSSSGSNDKKGSH
jgi:hypothetical protein